MGLDIDFSFCILSPSGLNDPQTVEGLKACHCNYYLELEIYLNTNSS